MHKCGRELAHHTTDSTCSTAVVTASANNNTFVKETKRAVRLQALIQSLTPAALAALAGRSIILYKVNTTDTVLEHSHRVTSLEIKKLFIKEDTLAETVVSMVQLIN